MMRSVLLPFRFTTYSSCFNGLNVRKFSSAAQTSPAVRASLENSFDLVVVGSGPSGQKCAIAAAKLGKRVAMIDKKSMYGGVCIHTGTIPSKTFREAVLYLTNYRQRGFYGKSCVPRNEIKSQDILDRVRKVEGWETDTIMDQLNRNGVTALEGWASFIDPHHIEISPADSNKEQSSLDSERSNQIVRGEKILLCPGTRPARNSMYPFDGKLIFDSDMILQNEHWGEIRHLVVVGAGVIAMEYASMFNNLPGVRVTIIDERPTFLDFVDNEVVSALRHIMSRQGATFRLGEKIMKIETKANKVKIDLESGKSMSADALFYAVGRQGNTDRLNIESAGLSVNKRGLFSVNPYFQTSIPHIYAAGDVIGFPALASTAQEQGRLAAHHMFASNPGSMNPIFPYGIYTIPEVSMVGKSEQDLTKEKIPYEIGVASFEETAKGQMIGGQHVDGFLKILFCPTTRKLFGVHVIGENATELIHIGQAVLSLGGTVEYFRDSIFNYPTMAETYRVAALDGLGRLGIL